jgi:hypothetical protein
MVGTEAQFTKLFTMQKLFDKYLANGPTMSPIPATPLDATYIKSIGSHSQPCDPTTFLSLNGLLIQLIEVRSDIAFAILKIS